jgi:hypothetical protein
MRMLPISLAIRVLGGMQPKGRAAGVTKKIAAQWLRNVSGEDFGEDAVAWGEWLNKNRWAYNRSPFQKLDPSEYGPKRKRK